ncbi:DUF4230 domain-containing protein [Kaistella yonginensis]|uniref:DUF4230 domain-containing protein n=1 Tax=Kaistella yonginensis TaxID=658267 RepID=UPI003F493A84
MKATQKPLFFIAGATAMLLLFFLWNSLTKKTEEKVQNDYYIITNQIRKMNKMVVMEQDFSSMQKTKITSQLLGSSLLPSTEKEIITFTKTNAQVTYDLSKMNIKVDSINKKLIIKELPNADIRIIPSVEIQSMDDSFFNRFSDKDFQKITKSAKDNAYKTVNQNRLRAEGRKQLLENLDQIFVLAKALNYQIEDQTGQLDVSKL